MLVTRARDTSSYLAFCNLVGGQDELVFDGHSVVLDDAGEVVARAPGFEEHLLVVDVEPELAVGRRLRDVRRRELDRSRETVPPVEIVELDAPPERRRTRRRRTVDAVRARARADAARARPRARATTSRRTGSRRSSSASRAGSTRRSRRRSASTRSGAERVHCVSMPSQFSSEGTRTDAAHARGEPRGATSSRSRSRASSRRSTRRLREPAGGELEGLAAENLQARVRGVLLMALSNTFGWLVVSTGNKSELAVGYSTLYGDMVGGFALLKDVFKTDVFRLARHLNERRRARARPGDDDRARAERRAPRRTSATPTRSRRTTSSTPCSRRTSSSTARARSCSRSSTRRRRAGGRARRPRRVQAPPGAARREAAAEGVRPRPPDADHEPLEGLTLAIVSSNLR